MGIHIFTKIKNADDLKQKKYIYFSDISFQEFVIFHIYFSENVQCFAGVFVNFSPHENKIVSSEKSKIS